jgi:hypothetical protein
MLAEDNRITVSESKRWETWQIFDNEKKLKQQGVAIGILQHYSAWLISDLQLKAMTDSKNYKLPPSQRKAAVRKTVHRSDGGVQKPEHSVAYNNDSARV